MAAFGGGLVEVSGLPREAVTQRVPLDAQVVGQLALARLPLSALDELNDSDSPTARPAPSHDPEGRARLPLPVAGVDEDDRRGASHRLADYVWPRSAGKPHGNCRDAVPDPRSPRRRHDARREARFGPCSA